MDNEYITELVTRMADDGRSEAEINEAIKAVSGTYADKAKYEAAGYICNVVEYPAATKEAALESAFAVVRHPADRRGEEGFDPERESLEDKALYTEHYERCMQIIWALNTDEYLRNLLQYGVEHTNYKFDENKNNYVVRESEGNNFYNMDLKYTGDIFAAYFCEELGWTYEAYLSGESQNKESKFN